jgi:hypothetical protein
MVMPCCPDPYALCRAALCCAVLQVLHPVEYAKVVSRIGNEMDLTQVRKSEGAKMTGTK